MAKMKKGPKLVLVAGVIATSFYGMYHANQRGYLDPDKQAAAVPQQASLPTSKDVVSDKVAEEELPGTAVLNDGPEIRYALWAWNAQQGLILANGGPETTEGSLMAKNGVKNLHFIRQDDTMVMQSQLISFAEELHQGNPQPSNGYHFVAIMGDGAAAFLQGINPQLKKFGTEYIAEVIGSAGYSRGEDKFMGLPEWKENPQTARGGLIAGYLRDGDWNIAIKWAGDNNIKNNPDETTWDEDAINWYSTSSYIEASKAYIAGKCEERSIVKEGKKTGETKNVCVNGVVTWTPGDVMVAQEKGGLVSIVSTKEYRWQMPNTIIGIKKWNQTNGDLVVGMLRAVYQGGDQVKSHKKAARRAAELSAVVYAEQDGDYWQRYFNVRKEKDAQGITVELGGSAVNNLADVLNLYGLLQGSTNIFASTYTVFGNLVVQQYPSLVPEFPPVTEILNLRYTKAIADGSNVDAESADMPLFDIGGEVDEIISSRSYAINFESGSANLTKQGEKVLRDVFDSAVVTSLNIEVHGHTDSQGDPNFNMKLSEDRAFAVKRFLQEKSSSNFPDNRVLVKSFGQTVPKASNTDAVGRAKNRRVEIILGVKN